MKKIVFLAMFVGLSLVSVQCTKTVEERIVERERTNTILSGSTAPTATIGNVGDYYIDLTSVNLYGPKTAEGWGNPVSLRGLQGQNGTDGQNGQDAPIPHIGDDGYWYIGNTKTTIKAQGNNGADGQNGVTPTISEDGYWIVNGQKTNVKAKGEKGADGQNGTNGQNGITPTISIDNNGYWVINGIKTDIKAKGEKGEKGEDGQNGTTPSISIDNDGYWVINGVKTNTKAKGEKGEKGQNGTTPTITIDNDGYWVINGIKSNTKAKGEKGEKGSDGQNGADAPKPNIKDGYWYIGNVNTNIKAQGERGLPGKDGSKIYAGQGNPPANTGREGDYYINTEDKIFYGPKTNTGWPSTGISLSAQQIITTDYELSPDGKTLLKWKNPNTRFIDMNADPKLKEVTKIENNAFYGSINRVGVMELVSIFIGDNVTEIGTNAFNSCYKLKSIDLPDGITKINDGTFANCVRLQLIYLPETVTAIDKNAFSGNIRLHSAFILNPTAFVIDPLAFRGSGLRNIYVPSGQVDTYKTANPTYQDLIK
jgi:hypothetical protein